MPQPRALVALTSLVLAGLLALSGCHSSSPASLPDGAALVSQSATAMRAASTAHIKISTTGNVSTLPFKGAEGDVTKEGNAKGTVTIPLGGQGVSITFVVIGSDFYIKAGSVWQKASAADVATYYDPRTILDPDKGVSQVLSTATGAHTEDTENVDGVDTYRVSIALDPSSVAGVVPGVPQGTTAKVWLNQSNHQLVKAELDLPNGGGTVLIELSNIDKPVQIDAPI